MNEILYPRPKPPIKNKLSKFDKFANDSWQINVLKKALISQKGKFKNLIPQTLGELPPPFNKPEIEEI